MRDLERRRLQRLTHSGEGVHRSQQRIKPRLEVDNLRQHALGRGFALGLIALNLYLVLGFGNLHVQRADGVDQAAEARRCGADVGLKLPIDIKEVGRRLGVRYVLEGSVRKSAGKVRIAGQLIDAVTGAHIWADRFERDLTDVFALQDAVTVAVVSAIEPKLLQTEIALATRRRPANLTAYDFYLRAMQQHYQTTREGLAEALRLAHRALELDPQFGLVAALAGVCHQLNLSLGHANDPQFERKEAVRLFRLALSIDDSDPEILAWASITSAIMVGDSESEIEMADRAVALNPNSHLAWHVQSSRLLPPAAPQFYRPSLCSAMRNMSLG